MGVSYTPLSSPPHPSVHLYLLILHAIDESNAADGWETRLFIALATTKYLTNSGSVVGNAVDGCED